jgi:isopenicillin-N N-acyltransferase-like protein
MLHVVDTVVVLEVGAEDGSGYVTAVEAGLLAKSGLNAAGLGLATNFLLSRGDDGRAGVPYHVTLRAILDAASADEAVDMLRAMPRCSSANYLLADAGGRAVDVEVLPGDALHVIEPFDGFLAHTNHFCAAEATAFEAGGALMPSSPLRLERLEALLGASGQRIGPADIRTALSDHVNFPAAVCCHPDPDLAESDRDITAVSIVMDLDSRRVELADGNPCSTPYRELDYASFLGSQVASAS